MISFGGFKILERALPFFIFFTSMLNIIKLVLIKVWSLRGNNMVIPIDTVFHKNQDFF